ncbi:urease accessory protein F-like isoform X2 [Tripterygium wilfordii]|uniref:urease accessory protein F-like isoform X2 n=1 Tax=Tripterygium wilfordii TaxID=458696 RepID=UPI0018F805F1|nr:urease accessory protein F-like isoform X2 [Tripterygium wilfordii]
MEDQMEMKEGSKRSAPMEDGIDTIQGSKRTASAPLQWSQWQLLDSILPTGGFAHSFGLEAAIQSCIISDPEVCPNLETWKNLDRRLDATLTNEVSRKASISQGSALMRVAAAVYTEIPTLKTMRDALIASRDACFHHALVFGLICGLLGMDTDTSQRAYMFITMRDAISAATRLNLIGPLGAAVLQHQVSVVAETILIKWMNCPVVDACQTAPLLDTVQGCHSYLFSRMFCS